MGLITIFDVRFLIKELGITYSVWVWKLSYSWIVFSSWYYPISASKKGWERLNKPSNPLISLDVPQILPPNISLFL